MSFRLIIVGVWVFIKIKTRLVMVYLDPDFLNSVKGKDIRVLLKWLKKLKEDPTHFLGSDYSDLLDSGSSSLMINVMMKRVSDSVIPHEVKINNPLIEWNDMIPSALIQQIQSMTGSL
jgi:hypothetical protein